MRDTSTRVFRIIRTHKPLIVCLAETRVNLGRVESFCNRIPKNWDWASILADRFSRGTIVL